MKKNRIWIVIVIFLVTLGLGAVGMFYAITKLGLFTETVINKSEKVVTVNDAGIADAVEKLYDAVVIVTSYKKDVISSSGTGFVYKVNNNTAYIMTNNHVIQGASKVNVQFTNGKVYEVKIVGTDEYSDIAVLSVGKDKILAVAEIGKNKNSRLGDTVFTIGAPLDSEYSWTITRGVISGKDRLVEINISQNTNQANNWVMSVMQTDAAINSGNSGGPLANANGEVIGVTNMKLVSDGVEGMGFAIPIEDALSYGEMLITDNKIIRPILGVGTLNVTDTQALIYQYGITLDDAVSYGAVIGFVQKGSPADIAGLEKGDVITKFGDYDIKNSSRLKYYLYKYTKGDKVKVTYIRGKATKTINITLTESSN